MDPVELDERITRIDGVLLLVLNSLTLWFFLEGLQSNCFVVINELIKFIKKTEKLAKEIPQYFVKKENNTITVFSVV